LPNLTFSADAHYHHLVDDVIIGGKFKYEEGAIRVPVGPGPGVRLNHEKVEKYAALYRRLRGYLYDRDPARPGWFAKVPNTIWADPEAAFWFDGTVAHAL
jgi:glucarate dehydratase